MARPRTRQQKFQIEAVTTAINRARNTISADFKAGMEPIAQEILDDVKARWVPYASGALHDSGRVIASDESVAVAFGDKQAWYAVIVHERMDVHHARGQARYLVRGVEAWRPEHSPAIEAAKRNTERAIRTADR